MTRGTIAVTGTLVVGLTRARPAGKRPSRAIAKGIRAVTITIPFNAPRVETTKAIETSLVPVSPHAVAAALTATGMAPG